MRVICLPELVLLQGFHSQARQHSPRLTREEAWSVIHAVLLWCAVVFLILVKAHVTGEAHREQCLFRKYEAR